jgi:hypothetical protein
MGEYATVDILDDGNTKSIVDAPAMNKRLRRQQGLRKARRLLRIYRAKFPHSLEWYDFGGKIEHHLLKTRVPCSCPMCGNPRRYRDQRTLQEIKSDLFFKLDMQFT